MDELDVLNRLVLQAVECKEKLLDHECSHIEVLAMNRMTDVLHIKAMKCNKCLVQLLVCYKKAAVISEQSQGSNDLISFTTHYIKS